MQYGVLSDSELLREETNLSLQWLCLCDAVVGVLNGDDFDIDDFTKLAADTHAYLMEVCDRWDEADCFDLRSSLQSFFERASLCEDVTLEFKAACLIAGDLAMTPPSAWSEQDDEIVLAFDKDRYVYDYTERDVTQLKALIAREEVSKSYSKCVYPSMRKDAVLDSVYRIGYRFRKDTSDEQKKSFCRYIKSAGFEDMIREGDYDLYRCDHPSNLIPSAFIRLYSKRYIKRSSGVVIRKINDSQLSKRVSSLIEAFPEKLLAFLSFDRLRYCFDYVSESDDRIEMNLSSIDEGVAGFLMAIVRSGVVFIVVDEEQSESEINETIRIVRLLNPQKEIYVCSFIEGYIEP